jgi:hypothetical protein
MCINYATFPSFDCPLDPTTESTGRGIEEFPPCEAQVIEASEVYRKKYVDEGSI